MADLTGATNNALFEIIGVGIAAVDDLVYVDDYPPADHKRPVRRRERHLGGLAATPLVAASRLGCNCAYMGMLGDDDLSRIAIDGLNREGVNTDHLAFHADARPIHSTIVIGQTNHTRNIFFQVPALRGTHPELPDASLIRQARVLIIDDFSVETTCRVARIAAEARIAIVADFELGDGPQFAELLALVDHLILSHDFASKITGETQPEVIAKRLWTVERKAVVITCGADGAWYMTGPGRDSIGHQPAFVVNTVDTTGCGDVFHGAYAAGLVYGMDIGERVRFAAAAAALKATKSGGQAGIPTLAIVNAFLKEAAQ